MTTLLIALRSGGGQFGQQVCEIRKLMQVVELHAVPRPAGYPVHALYGQPLPP